MAATNPCAADGQLDLATGFPLVLASLHNDILTLRQQRFGFDLETIDQPSIVDSGTYRFAGQTHTVLLTNPKSISGRNPDAPILINATRRRILPGGLRQHLAVATEHSDAGTLSIIERYNLVDDAGAAFIAGRLDAMELLKFLEGFALRSRTCGMAIDRQQSSPP